MLDVVDLKKKIKTSFSTAMEASPQGSIGIAVSGGGDSVALLSLSSEWAKKNGRRIIAATVDHGLRPESSEECEKVKRISVDLDVKHTTLRWTDNPIGNLQNSARNARYHLLKSWALENKLSVVLFGHTLDDNAETVVLRIIRGSGVDGLSGIAQNRKIFGLNVHRPLLHLTRVELRRYLQSERISWIEDPSNFDMRFDRIRVRKLLPTLSSCGLTPERLVSMAGHMSRAREALQVTVLAFVQAKVEQTVWGDLKVLYDEFVNCSEEVQLRILAGVLRWNSGKPYNPRFVSLKKLHSLIVKRELVSKRPLMGTEITINGDYIIFNRELSSIKKSTIITQKSFVWDNKWQIDVDPEKINSASLGPLGVDGAREIASFSERAISKSVLATLPAMFDNNELICVPSIDFGHGFRSILLNGLESFAIFLSKH